MLSPSRAAALLFGGLFTAALSFAQLAISTHSGLVQLTVGTVLLDDQPLHKTTTNLVEVKNGQILHTGKDGDAEILLTPGVFLRLGNDTSIRMDSNRLSDTRVSLLAGSAMVECNELLPGNAVAFTIGDHPIELRKKGLFRLEAEPAAIASIKGEAFVGGSTNMLVKQGKLLQLDEAVPQLSKVKVNKKDDLYAFSKLRSEDSVYATGVTSSSLYSSGFNGCTTSSWYLMSGVGMYSYLPCRGMFSNPFGYSFLGLNSGYMWDGPGYYMAPYAVYGYGYGSGFIGGGGGGGRPIIAGTGTGSAPGGTRLPAGAVKGMVQGNTANRGTVPVYAGPAFHGRAPQMPASMLGSPGMAGRSMQGMQSMRGMAGSSMGRSAGMGPHVSGGGAYNGGGMRGGGAGAGGSAPAGRPSGGSMGGSPHSGGGPAGARGK